MIGMVFNIIINTYQSIDINFDEHLLALKDLA